MLAQKVLFLYLKKIYTESAEVKLPAVEDYLSTIIEVHNVLQFSEIYIRASNFVVKQSYASFFSNLYSCLVQADCKFLIFAHHKIPLDGIEKFLAVSYCNYIFVMNIKSFLDVALADAVSLRNMQKKKLQYIRIDGKTEASTRQRLVNTFQETDNVKAAVVSFLIFGADP